MNYFASHLLQLSLKLLIYGHGLMQGIASLYQQFRPVFRNISSEKIVSISEGIIFSLPGLYNKHNVMRAVRVLHKQY